MGHESSKINLSNNNNDVPKKKTYLFSRNTHS